MVCGVLWIGARDVRAGGYERRVTLVQFVIYSVMVAGSVAALSEIWGELQSAPPVRPNVWWNSCMPTDQVT